MNDVILRTTVRVAEPVIALYALYLLLRGHNAPGGGFIAGLMVSAALVLRFLTFGTGARRRLKALDFRAVAGIGLLLAAGTGMAAVLFGRPFLTSAVFDWELPILGHVELATAVLFDVGVFFAVVGATMGIIQNIGEGGA